ncbi:hypothetical protein ACLMAJ_29675 [Nocardia sp. KC 131]
MSQKASDSTQWQREKRRDAYAAFLDAGAQARDELISIWRLVRSAGLDDAGIRARLESAHVLTDQVRRASATNFVEGPQSILVPTRRAEESIVIFRSLLEKLLLKPLPERNSVEEAGVCLGLEAQIRIDLDRFAASAREVLDAAEHQSVLINAESLPPAAAELQWLLAQIRGLQPEPWPIDVEQPLFATGIDSLALLAIGRKARHELAFDGESTWLLSSMTTKSVEEVAGYLALGRTNGGPGSAVA